MQTQLSAPERVDLPLKALCYSDPLWASTSAHLEWDWRCQQVKEIEWNAVINTDTKGTGHSVWQEIWQEVYFAIFVMTKIARERNYRNSNNLERHKQYKKKIEQKKKVAFPTPGIEPGPRR